MKRVWAALLIGVAVGAGALAPSAEGRGIDLGFTDPVFGNSDAGVRDLWNDRAAAIGGDVVLLGASWGGIAPASEPASWNPANPASPHYNWGTLDDQVADVRARGMLPAIHVIGGAPSWAEGKNRPSGVPGGTWKPRPNDLKSFGKAIAKRYSGNFPARGAGALPRVRHFQLWAEPNLNVYLNPQWKGGKPVGARHYRLMIRGFHEGVHAVQKKGKVMVGGTAPYGDIPGGNRIPPVTFWSEMLCLREGDLKAKKCPKPAKFDIAAHNPINVGRPTRNAFNSFDASTPNFDRLQRIVRKARKTGRVRPRSPKPFWSTEIWWETKPPDPSGVPLRRHAQYLAESAYILWAQKVKVSIWFRIEDPSSDFSQYSGLWYFDGGPKPAKQAFAFPFVADRNKGKRIFLWAKAPRAGRAVIQRKSGGSWKKVRAVKVGKDRIIAERYRRGGEFEMRVKQGSKKSPVYSVPAKEEIHI